MPTARSAAPPSSRQLRTATRVLFSSNTHSMTKLVMAKPPYDPLTDFTSIARVGVAPLLDRDVDEDAAEDAGRSRGGGAQESGSVDRRYPRARFAESRRDHSVHASGQGQSHHHALSRHRAGAHRRRRRPHPAAHRRHRDPAADGARGQGEGARGHHAEAQRYRAGHPDRRRERRCPVWKSSRGTACGVRRVCRTASSSA